MGWELRRTLAPLGELNAFERSECDLSDVESLQTTVRAAQAHLIVNAAAYTNVDGAESATDMSERVNATAVAVLAEEAKAVGACLVHYSTDYVFDGKKSGPYLETDPVNPLNSYGASKARGEQHVRSLCPEHIILRTSWVFASRGRNFLLTMLKLAAQKRRLRVVDDNFGSPTSARMIAEATALLVSQSLEQGASRPRLRAQMAGTYHLTAAGSTSWFGFAKHVFDTAAPDLAPAGVEVEPVPASQYPAAAARPVNSVLSSELFARTFGLRLPDWRMGVDLCLAELRESRVVRDRLGSAE